MSAPKAETGLLRVLRGEADEILFAIDRFDTPFLFRSSLAFGIGSSDIAGLDRGTPGKVHLAEFRRVGSRVVLVELNRKFLASGDAASLRAGLESFVRSVIWSGTIKSEDGRDVVVDATSLVVADHHDLVERLRAAGQGTYELASALSYVLADESKSTARATRVAAMISLKGPGIGSAVRDVTPFPRTLSFVQHLYFEALPEQLMPLRRYHPGSGGYAVAYSDHARDAREGTEVRIQPRFRLEPEGAKARSVARPIVFYVDPAIPEPIRSAIVEGGNWWQDAFARAGFDGAFRVEVLPEDLDLNDPGINTVWWVHRGGRGWSFGRAVMDPRTGEILNGRVLLGSQRLAQVTAMAEAILSPYGQPDEKARLEAVEHVVRSRVRLLAAHEIGHALGFVHNFASSHHDRPSVMDYPHPRIRLALDGSFEVEEVFPSGLGPWDYFLVEHAYGVHSDEELAELRQNAADDGLIYVADMDGAAPDAVHADAVPWVLPGDTFDALEEICATRTLALERFSSSVLPPERQSGELEERLAILQLLHRHEVEATARLVGGVRFSYGWAGDKTSGTNPVDAHIQWQALHRLSALVRAEVIALPKSAISALSVPGVRYGRSNEYLETRHGRLFDPLVAAESAALLVAAQLLEPTRLNRAAWQHASDSSMPGVREILEELAKATWRRDEPVDGNVFAGTAVHEAAGSVVIAQLLLSLEDPRIDVLSRAAAREFLRELVVDLEKDPEDSASQLASSISSYLLDGHMLRAGKLPRLPPGAPI